MEDFISQIQRNLIGNMIIEWCDAQDYILFNQADCSGTKCIRFYTKRTQSVFKPVDKSAGVWGNGQFMMYEIWNKDEELRVNCSVSYKDMSESAKKLCKALLVSTSKEFEEGKDKFVIRSWSYNPSANDSELTIAALDYFYQYELPYFESELKIWQSDITHHIKFFPKFGQQAKTDDAQNAEKEDLYYEGTEKDILTNKFERDRKARQACIEHYGAVCQICGFDFKKTYGDDFEGKIQVHHIVPLSQIREGHKVDPINDLIPVCPNCHVVFHSKKDGVFTVDEVKDLLKR